MVCANKSMNPEQLKRKRGGVGRETGDLVVTCGEGKLSEGVIISRTNVASGG